MKFFFFFLPKKFTIKLYINLKKINFPFREQKNCFIRLLRGIGRNKMVMPTEVGFCTGMARPDETWKILLS
ncbi:unnamed protein product [Blepharisma stoltei]|uniref:Uncharacterized protein n=1 Tax=Blepharisma stoltei TaxID=1481888 RepID=A0AAU9ITP3_9CILI|nr:unnamed protein product [Blepharisma stoltei]